MADIKKLSKHCAKQSTRLDFKKNVLDFIFNVVCIHVDLTYIVVLIFYYKFFMGFLSRINMFLLYIVKLFLDNIYIYRLCPATIGSNRPFILTLGNGRNSMI